MFEEMKKTIAKREASIESTRLLSEMIEAEEDEFLSAIDNQPLTADEAKECEKLLDKIPEYEMETEHVSKDDLEKADKEVHDPSLEELAESALNLL